SHLYTLSLHDALPISLNPGSSSNGCSGSLSINSNFFRCPEATRRFNTISIPKVARSMSQDSISGSKKATQLSIDSLKIVVSKNRSEEHTSELQSRSDL